jgi:hypothetical protein
MALQTITPNHRNLRKIVLNMPYTLLGPTFAGADPAGFRCRIGETVWAEWSELDRVLAQLRESHSIRLKVLYGVRSWMDGQRARSCVASLLPETSTGGIARLIAVKI